jgi:hypothetical protein
MVRNILVQNRLFRTRDGITVETSFNDGKFWMSSTKSIDWFNGSADLLGECEALKGEFLG